MLAHTWTHEHTHTHTTTYTHITSHTSHTPHTHITPQTHASTQNTVSTKEPARTTHKHDTNTTNKDNHFHSHAHNIQQKQHTHAHRHKTTPPTPTPPPLPQRNANGNGNGNGNVPEQGSERMGLGPFTVCRITRIMPVIIQVCPVQALCHFEWSGPVKKGNMLMKKREIFWSKKRAKKWQKISFLAPSFDQKEPFFDQKCRFGVFDRKKGWNDGKKGRNEKKKRFLFFRLSLFRRGWILEEKKKGEARPRHRCHHALTFISSDRYLFFQEACFQGHQIHDAPPCLGPTPSTDEKRQLKDDKPGIPMRFQGGTRLSLGPPQTSKLFQCLYKGQNLKHFSSSVKVTKYIKTDSDKTNT